MNKQELKLLAQKYLEGTATEEEKRLLNQWYDTTNDGWVEQVNTKIPETEDQIRLRMLNTLQQQINNKTPQGQKTSSWKRLLTWSVSAAALLLTGIFTWQLAAKKEVPKLVSVPDHKIIEIVLPDSSKVWLNAGSIFKYPKTFDQKNRTVELIEGRAYFEIKHRDKHPFIVKTKSLNVTVLGTSFDVRAYQKEGTTKVNVVTGKVGITLKNETKKPAIMLTPKQELVLSKLDHQIIRIPTKEIAVNAWCKSQLVFEQENLGNVFHVLEKKYNTKISVDNKNLLNERISITLSNQHLDTVMQILSFTKHFKYQMANDSITVIK
ncbi:FecR family protein [Pedobacter sp.]|jgi:transmembrane sensor|uniref:FecR family protein n=1 Tax=Pedobacter sp. TaxID=1411316 RepID=UPI002BA1EDF7|nr:FecR family protein [Pedobacter sp.]HWW40748.1 FecR family protein [Pedobacter sp.]